MNQENLEAAIESLRRLARDCETSRDHIVGYYNADGDTLEKAGYREPEDFSSGVDTAVQTLRDRATTIETYKDNIVELNESGVASMDADSVITLTLPDSFTFPEDPTTFASCAQAAIDADDLKTLGERKNDNKGGGDLPSGRKYDDLIASIEANKTDATYADSLIDDIGPENLTGLPLDVESAFNKYRYDTGKEKINTRPGSGQTLAILLGDVLATASCEWTSGRAAEVAEAIKESIDEEGEYGRITVLNAMLGGHDYDGDHVTDLVYGADFLVDLGQDLEAIDWNTISVYADLLNSRDEGLKSQAESWLGPAINAGPSFDPLAGVLYAMVPNDKAALAFLEPDGGSVSDAARVKELMGRHELGETLWTETWTGLANHTSSLYAGENVDADHPFSANAGRAAALCATVVNTIGEEINKKDKKVTDAAREDLTKVVAAYPWSVDQAARTDSSSGQPTVRPAEAEGSWCYGLTYQPQFTGKGLSGVMQTISRNEEDFNTVINSVATLEQRRMTFEANVINTATNGQGIDVNTPMPAGLQAAIQANSATAAFFLGASRAVVESGSKEEDDRNKAIVDTLFGLSSFIPGPGDNVGQLWKDTWSFGKDATKTQLKNNATETFTNNLTAAINESAAMKDHASWAETVTTITQMIGLGIIPADQANAALSGLVGDDGVMDPSKLDDKALDQLYGYFVTNPNDALNPSLHKELTDDRNYYQHGYDRGQGK